MPQAKAFALVVRAGVASPELLVFDHPDGSVQLPKGSVDPGEDIAAAALRELQEESGVTAVRVVGRLRDCDVEHPTGLWQRWHLFRLEPTIDLPDAWEHVVTGVGDEVGLRFRYRWVPVDDGLRGRLHSHFGPAVDALLRG